MPSTGCRDLSRVVVQCARRDVLLAQQRDGIVPRCLPNAAIGAGAVTYACVRCMLTLSTGIDGVYSPYTIPAPPTLPAARQQQPAPPHRRTDMARCIALLVNRHQCIINRARVEQLLRNGPSKNPPTAPPLDPAALSTARAYALFGWHGAPPTTGPGALGNVLFCTLCGAARMLGPPDGQTAAMAQRAVDAAAQAAALRGTTLGTPGPLRLTGTRAPLQVPSGPAQTIAGGALCSPGTGIPHGASDTGADAVAASPGKEGVPASTAWQQRQCSDVVSASSFTTWMAGFGSAVGGGGAVSASPASGPFGGGGTSAPLFGVAAMRASVSVGSKRPASPVQEEARWVAA